LDVERFTADVTNLSERLMSGCQEDDIQRLNFVKDRLIALYKRNIVKINHSVMELICARHLIRYGYVVDVEKQLTNSLVCDVFATKGDGQVIIEIETGFMPPEHALDPVSYYISRIASKIARYSKHASEFIMATPGVNLLPIPVIFSMPPRVRGLGDVKQVKALCDKYYKSPQLEMDEILNARLHMIYVINIDEGKVIETDIDSYFRMIAPLMSLASFRSGIVGSD
jgi:hypothetical protein